MAALADGALVFQELLERLCIVNALVRPIYRIVVYWY